MNKNEQGNNKIKVVLRRPPHRSMGNRLGWSIIEAIGHFVSIAFIQKGTLSHDKSGSNGRDKSEFRS